MQKFTSQDLQKKPSQVQEAALRAPVVITHHRRRRLVMLSVEEFERLRTTADPEVYKLEEMDDNTVTQIAKAKMPARFKKLDELMNDD